MSNGEFNYLRRAKGYTRPLSVLQIRAQVRQKYSRMSQRVMLAMLTPKRKLYNPLPRQHTRMLLKSPYYIGVAKVTSYITYMLNSDNYQFICVIDLCYITL